MEIEFSGYYEKDTYFKAIRQIYKPSARGLAFRVGIFIVFGTLYGMLFMESVKNGLSSAETARLLRYLITFSIVAYFLLQPYLTPYLKARELWSDPLIRRKIRGRVSPLGVLIEPMQDWLKWNEFIKLYRIPDAIILLTASRLFVLLQRNFFKSDQEWAMVQNLVNTKVQEVIGM